MTNSGLALTRRNQSTPKSRAECLPGLSEKRVHGVTLKGRAAKIWKAGLIMAKFSFQSPSLVNFHFFHKHVHVKMLSNWEKQGDAFPRFGVGPGICWFPETQLWKSWLCHNAFKFLADSEWVCSWVTERGDYWFPLVRPMGVIFQSKKWVLTPIAGDHCPRDIVDSWPECLSRQSGPEIKPADSKSPLYLRSAMVPAGGPCPGRGCVENREAVLRCSDPRTLLCYKSWSVHQEPLY